MGIVSQGSHQVGVPHPEKRGTRVAGDDQRSTIHAQQQRHDDLTGYQCHTNGQHRRDD